MQIELELLAPAKDKEIGIAAISCGADAVYIAADRFGAREAAGNSVEEIRQLVEYAHSYDARVYVTINTILYEEELEDVRNLICELYNAGTDALIVQDLGIARMKGLPPIPLFASTQCNIRTVEQAKMLSSIGFQRLILARELSLKQIEEIHKATPVPLEAFVHGALCVSYSGQCYLSQSLTGRSANRGRCAQACRWPYTLTDSEGRVLAEETPLLSLRDLNMSGKIPELVEAGITSFKIEGRLKNESYVRNTVLLYRRAIDAFIAKNSHYRRASAGVCRGGFEPSPEKTFNRGFTTLFFEGRRGRWRSTSGAKGNGEEIGTVISVSNKADGRSLFTYRPIAGKRPLANGDGLCFYLGGKEIAGARASLCNGNTVYTNERIELKRGAQIYRNYDIVFEREIKSNSPKREIPIKLAFLQEEGKYKISGIWEYGSLDYPINLEVQPAQKQERARLQIGEQLSKSTGIFSFTLASIEADTIPFFPISVLNGFRRDIAELAAKSIASRVAERRLSNCNLRPVGEAPRVSSEHLTYLANASNSLSRELYSALGAKSIDPAYELEAAEGAELMRTKHCLMYELGYCPKDKERLSLPLYLHCKGRKLQLSFDCARCEMTIK